MPEGSAEDGLHGGEIEVTDDRFARVGALDVRRMLPRRGRRTVGAWCFVDHFGSTTIPFGAGLDIAPHPHLGLQTVTWLFAGEAVRRDSLGTEQDLRPGQLNLMTAGRGAAHSEESRGGVLHGLQLWVAQPSATWDGPPAFEHHRELPRATLGAGATATLLVGNFSGVGSPARHDTDLVGVDLDLEFGEVALPLEPNFEHGLVVCAGALLVGARVVEPGQLAYLAPGRDELVIATRSATRALLIGGAPFPESVTMWWNFVGRSEAVLLEAWRSWTDRDGRFGEVRSALARVEIGPPPWRPAER